jgi:hypothetical protein
LSRCTWLSYYELRCLLWRNFICSQEVLDRLLNDESTLIQLQMHNNAPA